jgi:tRNA1Val (adenine37-N6)-methyltransferase
MIPASASSKDAPGYGARPICWKCSGKGAIFKNVKKIKKQQRQRQHQRQQQQQKKKKEEEKEQRPRDGDGGTSAAQASSTSSTTTTSSSLSSSSPSSPSSSSTATVACPVCHGAGTLLGKRKEAQHANAPGVVTKLRERPAGWQARGVLPVGNPHGRERLAPRAGEALTGLCGDWRIFQKVGGHRWSTEDIVTAWYAAQIFRGGAAPRKIVDLGCGIGSVLLQCAWLWPEAALVGVEAQPTSAGLARRSIEYNLGRANGRVKLVEGDIRDEATLASARAALLGGAGINNRCQIDDAGAANKNEKGTTKRRKVAVHDNDNNDNDNRKNIALVTGTPPYFHIDRDDDGNAIPIQGGMPSCVNSAPARNEFRGGVEVYCDAAARILRANTMMGTSSGRRHGVFVVTMAYQVARVEQAAAASGLVIFRRLDVIGKTGKTPLFASFAMRLAGDAGVEAATSGGAGAKKTHVETLAVRGLDLKHTDEYEALMQRMGIPPVLNKLCVPN